MTINVRSAVSLAALLLASAVLTVCDVGISVGPLGRSTDVTETASEPPGLWSAITITQGTVGRASGLSVGVVAVRASQGSRPATVAVSVALLGDDRVRETRVVALGERARVLGHEMFVQEVRVSSDAGGPPGSSRSAVKLLVRPLEP